MLNAAVQAVGLFEAKFAPYPYEVLSVVETESPDGQEYDGLVFLSSDFYDQYGGSNRSNMVSIGVHEIAHNWWFGLVGNDQALEPWLDEAHGRLQRAHLLRVHQPELRRLVVELPRELFQPERLGGHLDL